MTKLTIELATSDIAAFRKVATGMSSQGTLAMILLPLFVGAAAGYYWLTGGEVPTLTGLFGPMLLGIAAIFLVPIVYGFFVKQNRTYDEEYARIHSPQAITIRPDGLLVDSPQTSTLNRFRVFERVLRTEEHLFLMMADSIGMVLPIRCLPSPAWAHAFADWLEKTIEYLQLNPEAAVVPTPPPAIPEAGMWMPGPSGGY